jgi:hypothetical protein
MSTQDHQDRVYQARKTRPRPVSSGRPEERATWADGLSSASVALRIHHRRGLRPFYESLILLAGRAQDAGLLRADLVPADLPRIMGMLTSTLWTMNPRADGWRRYLAIIFEGLAPTATQPLPPAVTLTKDPERAGDWSL